MVEYTHEFHESGNGFPGLGDEVLIAGDCGYQIMEVTKISRIHTRQWEANMVYLALRRAERDYDELGESEKDRAWGNLHHVTAIDKEE